MSHINNVSQFIQFFAQLELDTLPTDTMRKLFIEQNCKALGVTENRFIEIIKNELRAIETLSYAEQLVFDTAIYAATLRCALFNARRCYHARLDVIAAA
jgi:hypothetical protein